MYIIWSWVWWFFKGLNAQNMWFEDNGWIAQGVLGRFLPHLACWTQRGRRGGGSNWAADGESFFRNISTCLSPFHIFFTISTYSSPFLHILRHLYIFFTISTTSHNYVSQASILKSTFSFCHRLVLSADNANSIEAATQVFRSTSCKDKL